MAVCFLLFKPMSWAQLWYLHYIDMTKHQKSHPVTNGPRLQVTTSKSAKENILSQTQTHPKNPTTVTRPKSTTAKDAKVSQSLQTPRAPSLQGAKHPNTAALLEKIASQKG